MAVATINISHCVQVQQQLMPEKNQSMMRARVHFSMTLNGKTFQNLYADISQPYGTDFNDEPVEVGRPVGYDGPFSLQQFSQHVETYYRNWIRMIRGMFGGASMAMGSNSFVMPHSFQIEVDTSAASPW